VALKEQFPPLDALDKKLLEAFPNKVVRKSYAKGILAFEKIPQYLSEFLINQHQDREGMLPDDAIAEITHTIEKYYPEPREKEKWNSLLMTLKKIQIIDHFEVITDLNRKRYRTHITGLNKSATVDKLLVQPNKYPELLCGGMWGLGTFEYIQTGDRGKVNMCDFESFQTRGASLKRYIDKRKEFTTEEWLNFLIKSIGLASTQFNRRQKFLYLCRLIPMVEPHTNFMELGPPGTGKSYLYENLTFYSRSVLGGEVTLATLIYNMNTRENGIVFKSDVVCFDEINKMKGRKQELVSKLQQIMASGHIERGDLDSITDVSFVFQGNLITRWVSGAYEPVSSDHFVDLPPEMKDSPFLDRIHAYIHGWEFRPIEDVQINHKLGLIANYFAEILHKLRRTNFYTEIDKNLRIYTEDLDGNTRGVSLRDKTALYHIISGFLKLIYPHRELTEAEWDEIARMAIELRQNVLDEIKKIEPDLFSRTLKYQLATKQAQVPPLTSMPEECSERISQEEEKAYQEGVGAPQEASEIPEMVDPLAISVFVTQDNLLTKPLPYWVVKVLIRNDLLRCDKGHNCQIVAPNLFDLPFITQDAPPLTADPNIKSPLPEIEICLPEIQKKIEVLDHILTDYHKEICQLNIIQNTLEMMNNEQQLKNLEELREEFFEDSEIDAVKQTKHYLDVHKKYLMESRKEYVNLNNYSNFPIFTSMDDLNQVILDKTTYWQGRLNQFRMNFRDVLEQSKNLFPTERIQRDELLSGAKFQLFAFDMNNLITSFRKKYLGRRPIDLFTKLKNQILPATSSYMAFYYASKHLERYQSYTQDLPSESNLWRIEEHRKYDGSYTDIDQNLTGEICALIEKYPDKITEFHLGSGDKDLHIVCEYAQKHKIPIFIHVVDESTLSKELASFATDVQIMFN